MQDNIANTAVVITVIHNKWWYDYADDILGYLYYWYLVLQSCWWYHTLCRNLIQKQAYCSVSISISSFSVGSIFWCIKGISTPANDLPTLPDIFFLTFSKLLGRM